MQAFLSAIGRLWSRGCFGKALVVFLGLFVLGVCSAALGLNRGAPAAAPTSAAAIVAPTARPTRVAAPQPTAAPEPTDVPTATPQPTEQPTEAPAPTEAPQPAVAPAQPQPTEAPAAQPNPASTGGVAPIDVQRCPDDAPIKGNIRDRNPDKGAKIYHLPGDNGYAQTKPERCFATAADAEAAGFRPVKK